MDPFATRLFRYASEREKELMMFETPTPLAVAAESVFRAAVIEETKNGAYMWKNEVVDLVESPEEREDSKMLWEICSNLIC